MLCWVTGLESVSVICSTQVMLAPLSSGGTLKIISWLVKLQQLQVVGLTAI